MDPEYNTEQATLLLKDAITTNAVKPNETTMPVYAINIEDYKIIQISQPPSWRVIKADNNDFVEEVFQIHGILCGSDLPPIQSNDAAYLKKKVYFLRQAVQLTGLGNSTFAKAMNNIVEIHKFMATHIGANVLLPWQSATYEGCDAIDANARYFSLRKNVPTERGQPFVSGVDPNGILASVRNQNIIHGYDNKVDYLREEKDMEEKIRTVRTEPGTFNIGDIVCATVSFVSFPTRDKRALMTTVLRALTLLKSVKMMDNIGQSADKISMTITPKANVIKRKVIFEDDKQVRDRMNNMTINDNMNTSDEEHD